MFICFDTEDNSKELLEAGRSGFEKQMTQIAAISQGGKRFYWSLDNCAESVITGARSKRKVEPSTPAGYLLEEVGRVCFLKWLARQPERFLYAHNVQYDLGNLFGKKLDDLDVTLVGGRLIKAAWGKKLFADSFNIWPMAVKKLAPAFGLEKLEFDSASREYVFRDVEIIYEAMSFAWDLAEKIGLPALPITLGGFCVKAWRQWGGENCHDCLEMARLALYGGRVELFKLHSDSNAVCYVDINSLYPFVMLREFPGPLSDWGSKLAPHGFADITVSVPKCTIAPLPFRDDEGRIMYPTGQFRGVWTMPEIQNAVSQGARIVKVHRCYGTTETMTPYRDFVQRLYAARLESKSEAERLFFKLLMNNLYGRLGTQGVIARSVWQNERNRFEGVPYGEKVLVKYQMPLGEETNWVHAAYVTAYGRLELQKYLRLLGPERMIYCDTDSCIFDCVDAMRAPDMGSQWILPPWYFQTGRELGEMKIEGWWDAAEAFAPKTYNVKRGKAGMYKSKGVPKRLAREFQETGHVHFDLPFKFREAISFYDRKNAKRLSVWRTVEKFKRSGYDRKILKDNRFSPCNIRRV